MGSLDPMSVQAAAAHVLSVDDDPSVRQMIVDYLGDNEMRVTAVASGREIADVMARETIDLQGHAPPQLEPTSGLGSPWRHLCMAPRALNVLQALLHVSCHIAGGLAHIGVPGGA